MTAQEKPRPAPPQPKAEPSAQEVLAQKILDGKVIIEPVYPSGSERVWHYRVLVED